MTVIIKTVIDDVESDLDTHYGEDEPEDEADKEDVDDGGYRVHQGIHHNLEIARMTR